MIIDSLRGDYVLLRNFADTPFAWRGVIVPTLEHAYQAEKTDDPVLHTWIKFSSSPGTAKRRGNMIPLPENWYARRVPLMHELLRAKFTQHAGAERVLLSTGNAQIIEGNTWHDQFWGDCRCGKRLACAESGENQLGTLLMELRDHLASTRFLAA